MPIPFQYNLSKTASPEEFEHMVKDCAEITWKQKFSRYGRNGQNQYGIDIFSEDGCILIQCKDYLKNDKKYQKKFLQEVYQDYEKALSHFTAVKRFVIVTALDRDASLQDDLLNWKEERNAVGEIIQKDIWFWDDICEIVAQDRKLLKKYYPELSIPVDNSTLKEILDKRLKNLRKSHPSFQLMQIDENLFPNGRPQLHDMMARDYLEEIKTVSQIFAESWQRDQNHLMIEGEGGIGKTVTLLSLTAEMGILPHEVPAIYVQLHELYHVPDITTIEDYIRISILYRDGRQHGHATWYEQITELARQPWNAGPQLLLLLDGFNEIALEHREAVSADISKWAEMPGIQVVTSSRFDVRQYMTLKGDYYTVCLQPLGHDIIQRYLCEAGIDMPKDENTLSIMCIPLMLALYVKTELIIRKNEDKLLEWKKSVSKGAILWNFLQYELLRRLNGQDIVKCVLLTEYIAPYIAWRMVSEQVFLLSEERFFDMIKEACSVFSDQLCNSLTAHAKAILRHNGGCHLPTVEDAFKLLTEDLNLFRTGWSNTSVRLMHQQFRDFLAAIHLLNQAHAIPQNRRFPDEWRKPVDYYVLEFAAELADRKDADNLWETNRNIHPTDRTATLNMMELMGRLKGYDYSELDFSSMDLTDLSLHPYRLPDGFTLRLPSRAGFLNQTHVSDKTFSPMGHSSTIAGIVISLDGRFYVSWCYSSPIIKVWKRNGGLVHELRAPEKDIVNVVIMPDSKRCISGCRNGSVSIWSLETGLCEKSFQWSNGKYWGQKLHIINYTKCICGSHDGCYYIYDTNTGERVHAIPVPFKLIDVSAVMPDNKRCIIQSYGTNKLWISEVSTGKISLEFNNGSRPIESIKLTPDGRFCVIMSNDKSLRIWDIEQDTAYRLNGHTERIASIDVFPDNRRCISGSFDGTMRIWDMYSRKCIQIVGEIEYGDVMKVAAFPDGMYCISGYRSGAMHIWNTQTRECISSSYGGRNNISCADVSPDGSLCVSRDGYGIIRIWDLNAGICVNSMQERSMTRTLAITPDKKHFITGCYDGTLWLWDTDTGISDLIDYHTRGITALTITKDGKNCISGAYDGSIYIIDILTGIHRQTFFLERGWADSLTCLLDEKRFVIGIYRFGLQVRDLQKERVIKNIPLDDGRGNVIASTSDGKYCLRGSTSKRLSIWNMDDYRCEHVIRRTKVISKISISSDGCQCALVSNDSIIRIFDLASGECRTRLKDHLGRVNWVSYLGESRRCISSSNDGTIRIWDAETGECQKVLLPLPGIVIKGTDLSKAVITPASYWDVLQQNGAIVLPKEQSVTHDDIPRPQT